VERIGYADLRDTLYQLQREL
jgi:hypothetical protein